MSERCKYCDEQHAAGTDCYYDDLRAIVHQLRQRLAAAEAARNVAMDAARGLAALAYPDGIPEKVLERVLFLRESEWRAGVSAEQKARDMLEQMSSAVQWKDPQRLTAGDVVELANLIAENEQLRKCLAAAEAARGAFTARMVGAIERQRPLCPDHRDKQTGKPCLACTIESAEREIQHWKDKCGEVAAELAVMRLKYEGGC